MTKKNLFRNAALICAAMLCLSVMLAGCKKKDKEVTLVSIEVTAQPTKKTYTEGEQFDPAGMVVTATYSNGSKEAVTVTEAMISYDFKTAGTKTVTITVTEKGITKTATVSVTVKEEEAYDPPFFPVESITGVPDTAITNTPLELAGTVNPPEATNKTIEWSILNTGATGASISIVDGVSWLNTTMTGTVIVQASIADGMEAGTPYTQNFTITVNPFSGDGSSDSPYLISTAADLNKLSELINLGDATYAAAGVNYRLTGDITLPEPIAGSLGNHTPIGNTSTNSFKGNFDGNSKTISNLIINNSPTDYIGLFGRVEGGKIQNLGLANVNIQGGAYTGGVAGYIAGSGASITGCYVTGVVRSSNNIVGGIAGYVVNITTTINNCYTTCSVSSVSGTSNYVGGIAGYNNGTVSECYATGAISGKNIVGGIVGGNTRRVNNCAALNPSVNRESGSTGTDFGRVAGRNDNATGLNNNAAFSGMTTDSGVSFGDSDINGTGIDKDAAKTQSTYSGSPRNWAFGTTNAAPWKWTVGTYQLPVFYWQTTAPIEMPEHLAP